jgi:hypothetical protein
MIPLPRSYAHFRNPDVLPTIWVPLFLQEALFKFTSLVDVSA